MTKNAWRFLHLSFALEFLELTMVYMIGNKEFKTKDQITKHCQQLISKYPDNCDVENEDLIFLCELFKFHDEWEQKSTGVIVAIRPTTTDYGNRCFMMHKKDGTKIDISVPHSIKCIQTARTKNRLPQQLLDFKSAARNAIKMQIFEFRDMALQTNPICELTKELLTRQNADVDHIAPNTFDRLLYNFCSLQKINPVEVDVESINGTIAKISNSDIENNWMKYHQSYAELRLISKIANLTQPKQRLDWSEIIASKF